MRGRRLRRGGLVALVVVAVAGGSLLLSARGAEVTATGDELVALRHVQLAHQREGDVLGRLSGQRAPGLPEDTWGVSCGDADAAGARECEVRWTQRHRSYADGDETWCYRATMVVVPDPPDWRRVDVTKVRTADLVSGRCSGT
jgi:hypothetical protein